MMKEKMDKLDRGIPPAVNPYENQTKLNSLISTIRNMEKPVLAMLEGAVAGAGVSIAMACDFSYAAEDCKLLFAFVNIGLMPDMGSYTFLTRRVGVPKATELFMLGKRFSGRQAADWGIITDAVPAGELEALVNSQAERLAAGPSQAYAKIKTMINQTVYQSIESSMLKEIEYQQQLNKTEDHREAVSAFFEKRPANFKGK